MVSTALIDVSLAGSYLCAGYELRVTERCLTEDLGSVTPEPFDDLANHEIIKAFVNRRRSGADDTRRVTPLSTGKTVYRLAYGDRHRGATWFDEANGVVWLLAYALHEFEGTADAFPYFKVLDAEGRLFPTEGDYRSLFLDRDRRFAEVVGREAEELLLAARGAPGEEQRGVVGGRLGVGVAVEVLETLEEVYLAVKVRGLTAENLPILQAAFFPDHEADDLEDVRALPGRDLGKDEIAFRVLRD